MNLCLRETRAYPSIPELTRAAGWGFVGCAYKPDHILITGSVGARTPARSFELVFCKAASPHPNGPPALAHPWADISKCDRINLRLKGFIEMLIHLYRFERIQHLLNRFNSHTFQTPEHQVRLLTHESMSHERMTHEAGPRKNRSRANPLRFRQIY